MKIMMSGGMNLVALKIKNKLSSNSNLEVLLADFGDIPSLGNSRNPILSLGDFNENVLAHQLLKICIDQRVDMYVPLNDQEWECLDRARVLFAEFDIKLGFPTSELENQLPKLSIFQDIILIADGEICYGEAYINKLDFPFSIQNFSGVLGVSMELNKADDFMPDENSLSDLHVAKLSFISI